jgi:UDP-N-acetylmuramoylalanine--D-glutamate ligase
MIGPISQAKERDVIDWQDKRVVILGAARQGTALARYLVRQGAHVVLNDRRPEVELKASLESLTDLADDIEWVFGGHPIALLQGTDVVCLSGGVPSNLPLVVEAQKRGILLSNDSQIFLENVPCKTIGVTGSAGKTTVTTLVGNMARAALVQDHVWVGGNIGNPLISVVDSMAESDIAIMELSSFQLEIMTRSTDVAAILNITPNHLDRHSTMEEYKAIKSRILTYQPIDRFSDLPAAVLGRDDPVVWSLAEMSKGRLVSFGLSRSSQDQTSTYVKGEMICLWDGERELEVMPCSTVGLRGQHNLYNVLAACAVGYAARLPIETLRAGVEGFTGVPHRLELVRIWKGSSWYNDSIATAPERVIAAIRSFDEPLVLLAGGRDKNLPWDELADLIIRRVDHLILFGEAQGKIIASVKMVQESLKPPGRRLNTISLCSGLFDAVQEAARLVEAGDVVLLSPGGTSFDEFRDFEDRGEAYRRWVMDLP